MNFGHRLAVWASAAATVYMLDILTKAAGQSYSIDNYSSPPAAALAAAAAFLFGLLAVRSLAIPLGAGLMFGALCGNGGQLIIQGYASDWLRLGPWLTNVADIAAAFGLLVCLTGYGQELRRGATKLANTRNHNWEC